jgi:photosystem II stability/assembly factor-like uncharacterized protein
MKHLIFFLMTIPLLLSCDNWKEVKRTQKLDDKVYSAAFFDKDNGLAVGYSGYIEFSENGGDRWRGGMNNSWCLYGIEKLNDTTYMASGNAGHVVVSSDHGRTWTHRENFGSTYPQNARYLSFSSEQNGWVATVTRLAETSNQGTTWTELALPAGISSIAAICHTGPGTGYLYDYTGKLFGTTDGGQSWTETATVVSDIPTRNELSTRRAPPHHSASTATTDSWPLQERTRKPADCMFTGPGTEGRPGLRTNRWISNSPALFTSLRT